MKRTVKSAIILFTIFFLCSWQSADAPGMWEEFSRSKDKPLLMKWLRASAASILTGDNPPQPLSLKLPPVFGRAGLFITLVKNGRIRGCFGAFDHSETKIYAMLVEYLKGAISYDPRYRPIELHELDDTGIILTVASFPEHVEGLNKVDITNFGVFIECDGSAGTVIVPAEFRTAGRLDRDNRFKDCRISRFRAVTIREEER